MNLTDDQSAYLVTVPPGTAGVFTDGMDAPILTRMPDGTAVERTCGVPPVGAERLAGDTFGRCGADYGVHGLSVAELARARRPAGGAAGLTIWVETAVLAHLCGMPNPAPPPECLAATEGLPRRLLATAVACAVDEAVAARSGIVCDRMSPAGLARHVFRALGVVLRGGAGCQGVEPAWLATPLLWSPVYAALYADALGRADDDDRPHPQTAEWTEAYGLRLPVSSRRAQLTFLQARVEQAMTDPGLEDLLFGTGSPSGLEAAIGLSRDDPAWASAVGDYAAVMGAGWLPRYLAPEPGRRGDGTDEEASS